MPFFCRSRKRKSPTNADSKSSYKATASSTNLTHYGHTSPPPPYQSPQASHQHFLQCPYAAPSYPPHPPPQPYWQPVGPYSYGSTAAAATASYLTINHTLSTPEYRAGPYLQPQKWSSCVSLVQVTNGPPVSRTVGCVNRGAALCDLIGDKFNDVISLMDDEEFSGHERDLVFDYDHTSPPQSLSSTPSYGQLVTRDGSRPKTSSGSSTPKEKSAARAKAPSQPTNVFPRATLYANSYLPSELPPFRVYMPTWPLLCLAAQYSRNAYARPQGAERKAFVDADCRMGTKAMVIKSVPVDDMNTIVFAIRGTKMFNLADWTVNLHTAPASPSGFLDDPGNLCHSGLLDVARKMIKPVAARLRQLLEENPSRSSFSLLITGHSAGGAVAALLYSHMLSETVRSELNILTGCFKRIHMVSFGAPPISLLPLSKPNNSDKRLRKSLFLSIINEGDPVSRLEKPYFKSLVEVYAAPPPKVPKANLIPTNVVRPVTNITWKVPPATLSNAGRLVVLRIPRGRRQQDVKACIATDDQLRNVMFGDVMMHLMDRYASRIETLAKRAVLQGLKVDKR